MKRLGDSSEAGALVLGTAASSTSGASSAEQTGGATSAARRVRSRRVTGTATPTTRRPYKIRDILNGYEEP